MLANYRERGEWGRRRKREKQKEGGKQAPFSSEITQNKRRKNMRWLQQLWREYITLGANKYTSMTFKLALWFWQVPLLITILTPQCTNEYKNWIQICKQMDSIFEWHKIRGPNMVANKETVEETKREGDYLQRHFYLSWNVMDNHNVYYSIHTTSAEWEK